MEAMCIKTKLKKELIEEVRNWFKTLKERIAETLESLENEGVFVESAYLDHQGDDLYLVYFMKAIDIKHAHIVFGNSELAIDHFHKDCWKKYCQRSIVLEELLDIDRLESVKLK